MMSGAYRFHGPTLEHHLFQEDAAFGVTTRCLSLQRTFSNRQSKQEAQGSKHTAVTLILLQDIHH